jgi:hypothetical protein
LRAATRRPWPTRYDVYLAIHIPASARLPGVMARMDNAAAAYDRTAASNGAMIVGWQADDRPRESTPTQGAIS